MPPVAKPNQRACLNCIHWTLCSIQEYEHYCETYYGYCRAFKCNCNQGNTCDWFRGYRIIDGKRIAKYTRLKNK